MPSTVVVTEQATVVEVNDRLTVVEVGNEYKNTPLYDPTFGDLFKAHESSICPTSKCTVTVQTDFTGYDGVGSVYTYDNLQYAMRFNSDVPLTPLIPGNPAGGAYVNTGGNGQSKPFDGETIFTGQNMFLWIYSVYGTIGARVWVDDEEVVGNPFTTPTGISLIRINFPTYGTYRVRTAGPICIVGVLCNQFEMLQPATKRKRVALLGDSYVEGNAFYYADSIPIWLRTLTGWEVYNLAQGGTGWVADASGGNGSTPYASAARLAKTVACAPDLVLYNGSGNDNVYTPSQVSDASLAGLAAIREQLPSTPVVLWGVEPLDVFRTVNGYLINDALEQTVNQSSNAQGFVNPLDENWFTGTGDEGAPASDGNQDKMVCADNYHPSGRGAKMYTTTGVDRMRLMKASLVGV